MPNKTAQAVRPEPDVIWEGMDRLGRVCRIQRGLADWIAELESKLDGLKDLIVSR